MDLSVDIISRPNLLTCMGRLDINEVIDIVKLIVVLKIAKWLLGSDVMLYLSELGSLNFNGKVSTRTS